MNHSLVDVMCVNILFVFYSVMFPGLELLVKSEVGHLNHLQYRS